MVAATTDEAPQCLTCRNSRYFHEGACLDACPAGLAHVGKLASKFGRTCEAPHACVRGMVATEGHVRKGKKCKCHSSSCLDCDFAADAADISASCTRCTNKLFHQAGDCVEACPADLTHHGLKKTGRTCVAPFSCSAADLKAGVCQCHKRCKKMGCAWEAANAPKEHTCL